MREITWKVWDDRVFGPLRIAEAGGVGWQAPTTCMGLAVMPEVSMSLAEKIGQLFIVGFEGTEVTPELEAWMATYGWGV